jgi:hypothetical protein
MKRSLGAKTLIVPTPTWIVGSYDKHGKPIHLRRLPL